MDVLNSPIPRRTIQRRPTGSISSLAVRQFFAGPIRTGKLGSETCTVGQPRQALRPFENVTFADFSPHERLPTTVRQQITDSRQALAGDLSMPHRPGRIGSDRRGFCGQSAGAKIAVPSQASGHAENQGGTYPDPAVASGYAFGR